eukprot:Phypoly_transcript_08921.p1 GENE.Phypoly_transcript_08921~~Phypoly_transcript_08921.p1  ORF type:complete len:377 (+),score=45.84 Phypoly_transcript_08921:320-1450(+)
MVNCIFLYKTHLTFSMPTTRKLLVLTTKKRKKRSFLYDNIAWVGVIGSLVALIAIVLWNYNNFKVKAPETVSHSIITTKKGMFGNISVVRDNKYKVDLLLLIYGKSIIGGYWEISGNPSLFTAFEVMSLALYAHPSPKSALVVGLGIGTFVRRADKVDVICDVVEIDPAVVSLSKQYFGFSTKGQIYTEDAQSFIARTENHYDIIVHDIFSGEISTSYYTLESLQKFNSALNPNGVFILNYVGMPKNRATYFMYSTLRHIWPHVRCFLDYEVHNSTKDSLVNMIFFSSHKPIVINPPPPAEKTEESKRNSFEWVSRNYPRMELDFHKVEVGEEDFLDETNKEMLRWRDEEKREYVKAMLQLLDESAWRDILSSKAT